MRFWWLKYFFLGIPFYKATAGPWWFWRRRILFVSIYGADHIFSVNFILHSISKFLGSMNFI